MRFLSPWLAVFMMVLGVAGARAEHKSGKWNCNGSQIEMNFCASAQFQHVDDELNALYRRKLDQILDDADKARFREAQRAWIVFRDKACLYQVGLREESGSIWPLEHFGCLEYHTKRRIEDMKEYLK